MLSKDFVFKEYVEAKESVPLLEDKINILQLDIIKCQDRPTFVQEGNAVFMAGAVGFALGLLAMGFALKH